MTAEQLILELTEIIKTKPENDIFRWFVNLNKKYKKLRKEGKVDEDLLIELTEFWISVQRILGEDFIIWLEEMWGSEPPTLVCDISDFLAKYSEVTYNRYIRQMDNFEIREAELLADAIWEKNTRTEIQCDIYDWNKDDNLSIELTIPRNDREGVLFELKKICAKMIYNRGSMFARFYSKRGEYELAGVKAFNGTGEWSCLSEWELSECFEDGLYSNEKAIILEHKENEVELTGNDKHKTLLYFEAVNR